MVRTLSGEIAGNRPYGMLVFGRKLDNLIICMPSLQIGPGPAIFARENNVQGTGAL